jgi:hypothetical protein
MRAPPSPRNVSDISSIPALIPLSLLEAIRNLDTPVDDGLAEVAPDIVSKRLGLSATVANQIERYRYAAERDGGVPRDEAVSVLRLVGRRADAALVFADAGRRAARMAAREAGVSRTLIKVTPAAVGRRVGSRASARAARRAFAAELRHAGSQPEARMKQPLSIEALPEGQGCAFYGAAFAELLRHLTGFEGTMIHDQCRSSGAPACVWRGAAGEVYE